MAVIFIKLGQLFLFTRTFTWYKQLIFTNKDWLHLNHADYSPYQSKLIAAGWFSAVLEYILGRIIPIQPCHLIKRSNEIDKSSFSWAFVAFRTSDYLWCFRKYRKWNIKPTQGIRFSVILILKRSFSIAEQTFKSIQWVGKFRCQKWTFFKRFLGMRSYQIDLRRGWFNSAQLSACIWWCTYRARFCILSYVHQN